MKFREILKENYDFSLKSSYKNLFKLFDKNGLNGNDTTLVNDFLNDKLQVNPVDSAVITVLYNKNYKEDGNYDDINQTNWTTPSNDTSADTEILSQLFSLPPDIFVYHNGVYEPMITVTYSGYDVVSAEVTPFINIRNIAKSVIVDKIDEQGYEWLNDGYLEKYLTINDRVAEYNAEQTALESFKEYLTVKEGGDPKLTKKAKISLIDEIYLGDEYEDSIEQVEDYFEEIDILKEENLVLSDKLRKLEREIEIITTDIERLSDTVDYGDEDEVYYSSFREDISELELTLNNVESKYSTIANEVDDNDTEISRLEIELSYHYDTYMTYTDDEEFKKLYIEERVPLIVDDYEQDILGYIYDSGFTIDDAVDEGMVYMDDRWLINEALEPHNITEFLYFEAQGKATEILEYEGVDYFIILTFKHSKTQRNY
jgi:hypothetical protein